LGVNAIGPSVALLFSDINGNAVVRYGMLLLQAVTILFFAVFASMLHFGEQLV
jgi:hypothetical protein